jgi:hypothetical protein
VVAADVGAVGPGGSGAGPPAGGSAARVTAGLRELAEVEGDPGAGDAAILYARPAGDGGGLAGTAGVLRCPRMSSVLLPPGQLALALTLRARLTPFSLTYGGE